MYEDIKLKVREVQMCDEAVGLPLRRRYHESTRLCRSARWQ
jgi:hypothetical protein